MAGCSRRGLVDKAPDGFGGNSVGNSVPREMHSAVMSWPMVQTGKPADPGVQAILSSGNGLMRPLEVAAKKAGVEILLEHKMTSIYRQSPNSGRKRSSALATTVSMLSCEC